MELVAANGGIRDRLVVTDRSHTGTTLTIVAVALQLADQRRQAVSRPRRRVDRTTVVGE